MSVGNKWSYFDEGEEEEGRVVDADVDDDDVSAAEAGGVCLGCIVLIVLLLPTILQSILVVCLRAGSFLWKGLPRRVELFSSVSLLAS